MLAMVGYSANANDYMLWTHEIGSQRTTPLEGTHGANYPFWSPDGKSLGFFADGKLKKVDVSGGQVQVLCDAPNGRGGAWNREGTIVFFSRRIGDRCWRVASSGGSPVCGDQGGFSRALGSRTPLARVSARSKTLSLSRSQFQRQGRNQRNLCGLAGFPGKSASL